MFLAFSPFPVFIGLLYNIMFLFFNKFILTLQVANECAIKRTKTSDIVRASHVAKSKHFLSGVMKVM